MRDAGADAVEARRRFEDDAQPQGPLTPTSSPRGFLLPLGLQPRSFSSALGALGDSSAPRLPVLELRGFRLASSSSGLVRLRGVVGGHHVVSAPFRSEIYCSAWLFESALRRAGFSPSSPATVELWRFRLVSSCFGLGVVVTAPAPPGQRRDSAQPSPVRPLKHPQLGYSCPLDPGKCPVNSLGWLLCWGKSFGVLNVAGVGRLEGGSQLQGFLPRGPPSSVVGALGALGRAPRDCWSWSCGASDSSQAASALAWWSPPQPPPTFDFPTRSLSRAVCKALPARLLLF